jgi:hypothetical protein
LGVLHQTIRSLSGKSTELEVLLETGVKNVDVLCFTEHWSNSQKLHAINIDHYIVANTFCSTNNKHSGSFIYVNKNIVTKELN